MGGVAIAISLVPPLCVVGIALRMGELGPANGALMLFITNFLTGRVIRLIRRIYRRCTRSDRRPEDDPVCRPTAISSGATVVTKHNCVTTVK
mgnify:CR=1 FL=1